MYDNHNLSELSDEELIAYRDYHNKQATLKDGGQLVRKILLNVRHFV